MRCTFVFGHFGIAFFALAAVVLAVTGAEALYADMGHFGRQAITWGLAVSSYCRACTLSYLGQGALLLGDESTVSAPFFLLTPGWAQLPMVLLATAATVIASQAVITGAYSVASQAARLGYLPRLRITHTSESTMGQIYVPWINGLLMVAVLILVFAFRSSAALAYAFGMAVTGTITITTLLFFYIAPHEVEDAAVAGHDRRRSPVAGGPDVPRGEPDQTGPRGVAAAAHRLDCVHRDDHLAARARHRHPSKDAGRGTTARVHRSSSSKAQPPLLRVPGTAVFLNRGKETTPLAMRANCRTQSRAP